MEPLISVYLPTYNRLELLKRAVQSIQNQTYKNFEIIIVDDNSSDGTQEFLEKIAREDSRVRYFLKNKNSVEKFCPVIRKKNAIIPPSPGESVVKCFQSPGEQKFGENF